MRLILCFGLLASLAAALPAEAEKRVPFPSVLEVSAEQSQVEAGTQQVGDEWGHKDAGEFLWPSYDPASDKAM